MSLKSNALYNILLNVSNVLFPFITTPYISKVLGVENIGIVNFAITYASYFVMIAMLGVPTYGMRVIASYQISGNDHRQAVFIELSTIIFIFSLIVSSIYVISIFAIPQLYEQKDFLLVAGLTVYLASLNIEWYFGGRERFKLITVRSLVVKIAMTAGMFIFVRTRQDVMPYLLLMVGATLLNHVWNWIYLLCNDWKKVEWNTLRFKYHIKPLLMLFSATLAINIYTMLDTIMLGFISDYNQVGYYTSAMKISRIAMPLVTAMSPVVFARVSALKESGETEQIKQILHNSFSYMYILAVPLTIGLVVLSPRFVPMFFGPEFMPTILPMQLLALLVIIIGISNVYGTQMVQAMGHDKQFLTAVIVGTIINFTLNMLLIKPYGAIGASIASIAAEIVVLVVMAIFAHRIINLNIGFKNLVQPVVASLPIIVFSVILNNYFSINHITYFSILIISSGLSYFGLMLFVFKDQTVINLFNSVLSKFTMKS